MKLIITGATGFVGRNLAERFYADGFEVVALGRSLTVGKALQDQGIAFKPSDIRDKGQLMRTFCRCDCVIHCAAKSGPWGRYKDFHATNVVGTRNVMAASRDYGIPKVIFISTPSVYFTGEDRYDISEDDPLPAKQASNYSESKRISEIELAALQAEGIRSIVFRPRALIGRYDNTFGPRIIRMSEKGRIPMINGGKALVDIACMDNFVDAVGKALKAPDSAWNQTYNISNGAPITVARWFSQILDSFGKPFRAKPVPEGAAKMAAGVMEFMSYLPFVNREPPMTRFTVGYMAKSMTLNIHKARKLLGYEPEIGNREGFRRYADWVKSSGGLNAR